MTTIDRTGASDAEFQARVAAFDAAPVPPEVAVETVARAILHAMLGDTDGGLVLEGDLPAGEIARLITEYGAAAALAALPPSPAEQAVKRVQALADEYERRGRINADPTSLDSRVHQMAADRLRAALASPAPAPQGERACYCGRLGHRLGGPILHKRTEECPR